MKDCKATFARLAAEVRIESIGDIRRAALALKEISAEVGNFRVAPCANIASKELMVDQDGDILAAEVFGWTGDRDRWWENTRLALESPIPQACRYESEPFWCNAQGMHTRHFNDIVKALDLSNFRERAMTYASIVAPVHLAFGQVGAVSFTPFEADRVDLQSDYELHGDLLAFYARVFVSSYVKVMGNRRAEPPSCRLRKREVECLRWAALGKTDAEISVIIGRSSATIRFHIHNAAMKLDAVNRSQTVFKAAQLGYLGAAA